MNKNYQLGLLYLVHLLVSADGVVDESEKEALKKLKKKEKISDELYAEFESNVKRKREREIYQEGIAFINNCTLEEKLHVFVILYKLSEVDGHVHLKEVRLLLYSIKMVGIEFDDVVSHAKKIKAIF
jgi:uncharacterized tellurite resistance protein B-like protein